MSVKQRHKEPSNDVSSVDEHLERLHLIPALKGMISFAFSDCV